MSIDGGALRDWERGEEIGEKLDGEVISFRQPQEATPEVEQELQRLSCLSRYQYEQERTDAASRLGMRPQVLDSEIKERRRSAADGGNSGTALVLEEPEPWPEPVNGADLLDELAVVLTRFVKMPEGSPTACALWIMHTWAHDAARISPILAITSPEKRCGKTTLMGVLNSLARKPLPTSNITPSALYRAVEKVKPSLLMDEADTFLNGNDQLRGILDSGHRKEQAYIVRNVIVGEDYEPRKFCTWAPKAVALIGELRGVWATLADRSVPIRLRRRIATEPVERWRDAESAAITHLPPKLLRWATDHHSELRDAMPSLPAELHDRAADNFEPLFAIADAAGGKWPDKARKAATMLTDTSDNDASAGVMLLTDMRELFDPENPDETMEDVNPTQEQHLKEGWTTSHDLIDILHKMEDRPWPEWGRARKPISQVQVGRLLTPFGIKSKKLRRLGITPGTRGYTLDDLREAFARYIPARSATTPQVNKDAGSSDSRSATERQFVADRKPLKAPDVAGCGVVAHQHTLEGEI